MSIKSRLGTLVANIASIIDTDDSNIKSRLEEGFVSSLSSGHYIAGGNSNNAVNFIDRLVHPTAIRTATGNTLTLATLWAGVTSSTTHGWIAGGYPTSAGVVVTRFEKVAHADSLVSAASAVLSLKKAQQASITDSTNDNGYHLGGWDFATYSQTDKVNHNTDTSSNSASAARTSADRIISGAQADTTHGYTMGNFANRTNKTVWLNDITSDLGVFAHTLQGPTGLGRLGIETYHAGGGQESKINATTDLESAASWSLSTARFAPGGTGDGSTVGFFAGGQDVVATDRVDYSAQTAAVSATAALSTAAHPNCSSSAGA